MFERDHHLEFWYTKFKFGRDTRAARTVTPVLGTAIIGDELVIVGFGVTHGIDQFVGLVHYETATTYFSCHSTAFALSQTVDRVGTFFITFY
jgi:hypothetical protein